MPKRKPQLSAATVNEAYERLVAQGFSPSSKGRPRAGARPLSPALAAALGITERRARQVIARRTLPPGTPRVSSARAQAAARAVREQLQRALGTKVELDDHAGVGTIKVHYSGYAQLQALLGSMGAL